MSELHIALLYAFIAGATIPLGGALARLEGFLPYWLENELRHSVIAFGGGVLFAAISLVLVPEGGRHSRHGLHCSHSAQARCVFFTRT